MKNLIVLPCLILACVFLTGCFGLVVAHPRQKSSELFCLGSRGELTNGTATVNLTETNVLDLWGPPDAKRTGKNGEHVWRYQGEYHWGAVIPMYLIPVPLPFPAGHDYVEIYFQNGIAQKASRTVYVGTGAAIGAGEKGYMLGWESEDKL